MPTSNYPNPFDPALPICSDMPSSHDGDHHRRRRKHDPERDPDSTISRDKQHRSSRQKSSSKLSLHKRSDSKERTRERDSPRPSSSEKTSDRGSSRKVSVVLPELERRESGEIRQSSVSYPNFSKAHSREAVGSREDIGNGKSTPFTPDATELEGEKRRRHSTAANSNGASARAPPSPPLTADEPDIRRSGSQGSMRRTTDDVKISKEARRSAENVSRSNGIKNARSGTSLRREACFGESEVSSMPGAFPEEDGKAVPLSSRHGSSTITDVTITDSDATSIAPKRTSKTTATSDSSPLSISDSQPKTPTQEYPTMLNNRATPVYDVGGPPKGHQQGYGFPATGKSMAPPPPPPPPPPPISDLKTAPRVDYLLKNGGLQSPISKRLVQPVSTAPVQQYNFYHSPGSGQSAPLEEYNRIFGSIHKRLDDYLHVLNSNGSLAVATGYKSVARRLLDKLSQVFARDISSERCDCVVCRTTPQPNISDEEDSGLSWGEILEFVSGRQELPQWPPFNIQSEEGEPGANDATPAPMQKLDIDVPEEYRDHYIRQNQKTKRAVQSWLALQVDLPSSPPEEADEDTLMFAMMTKLTPHQRNLFIALMHGQSFVSESRAPTPAERPAMASTALKRARKALQRLYRLDRAPRDCESAMYLLNNPHLHGMLATLAEVNEAEWEILISGRFDGFLWSGAEAPFPPSVSQQGSRVPSRNSNAPFSRNTTPFSGMSGMPPSRNTTPFSPLRNVVSPDAAGGSSFFPSRGPTPGLNGVLPPAPVQLDEDTEIAVTGELERNLFLDMECLEDAFEQLHQHAELVRQKMRERSSGLSAQSQLRRAGLDPVGIRLDTPASGITDFDVESEDDGLGDTASLAPDDSASQISSNKRRHRYRRERRTTPANEALPEEDESVFEEQEREKEKARKDRIGGRRSSRY